MSAAASPRPPGTPTRLWPNLGAEEGTDWQAVPRQPAALAAAQLWALIFGGEALLEWPDADAPSHQPWRATPVAGIWPAALGTAPKSAIFEWLERAPAAVAWLATESLERHSHLRFGQSLGGPDPKTIARLHDKAFAIRAARELDLAPANLMGLIEIADPEELASPESLFDRLDRSLERWPSWTQRRFTLKPRQGTSGRGRLAGRGALDREATRGALGRLAARGGFVLEPWLQRTVDLSVSLFVPRPEAVDSLPTLLGSLEMITHASGLYRGHCGEIDSRGRVFSGHPLDESIRADAAALAQRARTEGFFGACGVDSFCYVEGDRERLRSAVEFNARMTMGITTIGVLRRALPLVKERLDLTPGARRGFLLTVLGTDAAAQRAEMVSAAGGDAIALDLSAPDAAAAAPRPALFLARDRASLRDAHRRVLGC